MLIHKTCAKQTKPKTNIARIVSTENEFSGAQNIAQIPADHFINTPVPPWATRRSLISFL